MSFQSPSAKIGYTRSEFGRIFQIYSQNVYSGLFRDFSFSDINGRYFISFKEEANKTPLVTIEKRRLGPDRSLFVATTPGPKGEPAEVVRSEKIDIFTERLKAFVQEIAESRKANPALRVIS